MFRKLITGRVMIPIMLCLQVLPLLIFPARSYSLATQEWWLPVFLCLLTILSLVEILLRRSIAPWPWYLLAFSQGFNIISRVMLLFPHATSMASGSLAFLGDYIAITIVAICLSAFEIWYCDLPEVRQRLLSRASVNAAA